MRAKRDGTRWTEVDVATLMTAWLEDQNLTTLATKMERTGGSVCAKLRDLKILTMDTSTYVYCRAQTREPYMGRSQIKLVDQYMLDTDPKAPWTEFFEVKKK